jgi:hypothetical protein
MVVRWRKREERVQGERGRCVRMGLSFSPLIGSGVSF